MHGLPAAGQSSASSTVVGEDLYIFGGIGNHAGGRQTSSRVDELRLLHVSPLLCAPPGTATTLMRSHPPLARPSAPLRARLPLQLGSMGWESVEVHPESVEPQSRSGCSLTKVERSCRFPAVAG